MGCHWVDWKFYVGNIHIIYSMNIERKAFTIEKPHNRSMGSRLNYLEDWELAYWSNVNWDWLTLNVWVESQVILCPLIKEDSLVTRKYEFLKVSFSIASYGNVYNWLHSSWSSQRWVTASPRLGPSPRVWKKMKDGGAWHKKRNTGTCSKIGDKEEKHPRLAQRLYEYRSIYDLSAISSGKNRLIFPEYCGFAVTNVLHIKTLSSGPTFKDIFDKCVFFLCHLKGFVEHQPTVGQAPIVWNPTDIRIPCKQPIFSQSLNREFKCSFA